MPKSLNRVQLLGRIGSDPDVKQLQDGTKVAKFSIATTENYKNQAGEMQEITDWHKVVIWGKLAEIAEKYLSKGSKIMLEGKLKSRSYEKNGEKRFVTEVKGDSLIMLDGKKDEVSTTTHQATKHPATTVVDEYFDPSDEDIPF